MGGRIEWGSLKERCGILAWLMGFAKRCWLVKGGRLNLVVRWRKVFDLKQTIHPGIVLRYLPRPFNLPSLDGEPYGLAARL